MCVCLCETAGLGGGKMRRMESVLWSDAGVCVCLCVCAHLNKVAVDPTGTPIAPAVTVVNRHGI